LADGIAVWVVFVLTVFGIAYASYAEQPMTTYWLFFAPLIGALCVGSGWRHTHDRERRVQLIATQALHWLACLVVMELIVLPDVQGQLTANGSGLARDPELKKGVSLILSNDFQHDAVGRCVGIPCDAISGRMKLSLQAARSIA
jgi:hypothetical protein